MATFKFNKAYVFESLDSSIDKLTGEELFNDLLRWKPYQLKDFQSELLQVHSLAEFDRALAQIKSDCKQGIYPVIHFEIHGHKDKTGLVLSSNDLISWEHLSSHLSEINVLTENNLFITLAVCHGAYLMQEIKMSLPSPFWGIIGSFDTITEQDLALRYNEFYDEFLRSFDMNMAIIKLHQANPNIPSSYRFINSEQTFMNSYKLYADEKLTSSAIKGRFKNSIVEENLKFRNRSEKRKFGKQFESLVWKTRSEYFNKHRKIFFMIDRYPANKERFKLTLKDAV